jgi:hypothetical protein
LRAQQISSLSTAKPCFFVAGHGPCALNQQHIIVSVLALRVNSARTNAGFDASTLAAASCLREPRLHPRCLRCGIGILTLGEQLISSRSLTTTSSPRRGWA